MGANSNSSGREQRNRINGQIRAPEVRLLDSEGEQVGVVSLREARRMAEEAGLDLVEISPNSDPPVVRVMDYGKFTFQENKRRQVARKKQKIVKVKEVKFRPGTAEGDFDVKVRSIRKFLEEGDKVKITVWFRGREMAHQDLGLKLLERIKQDMQDCSKVEFFPKMEGRQFIMILAPKKTKS